MSATLRPMSTLEELQAQVETIGTEQETLHEAFRQVDGDAHSALAIARQNVKLMTTLRATQLEHGARMDRMEGKLDTIQAGQATIVGLLNQLIGDSGSDDQTS